MTLEQAERAAERCMPVICRGIEFMRITQTGHSYSPKDGKKPYVVLQDRYSNSTIRAIPEEVELVGADRKEAG